MTWTNKDQRLLSHTEGRREWVPPNNYRVAEVRLLHDVGTVGEIHATEERGKENLLIRDDSLNAFQGLTQIPEFARAYVRKGKLAYIDPPFNTQRGLDNRFGQTVAK